MMHAYWFRLPEEMQLTLLNSKRFNVTKKVLESSRQSFLFTQSIHADLVTLL